MHIATLNDKGKLEVELVVERGRGCVPWQNRASGAEIKAFQSIPSTHRRSCDQGDATRAEQRTD